MLSVGHLPLADVVDGVAGFLEEVGGAGVLELVGRPGLLGKGCHVDGLGRHVELAPPEQLPVLDQTVDKPSAVCVGLDELLLLFQEGLVHGIIFLKHGELRATDLIVPAILQYPTDIRKRTCYRNGKQSCQSWTVTHSQSSCAPLATCYGSCPVSLV